MNISKRFLLGIAFVMSFSSLCYSQDIASDFEQVLGALREKAARPRRNLYYYDMEDAVNALVAKHKGPSAVEFLEEKIGEPNSRKLALICLAGLVATDKAAEDAL